MSTSHERLGLGALTDAVGAARGIEMNSRNFIGLQRKLSRQIRLGILPVERDHRGRALAKLSDALRAVDVDRRRATGSIDPVS
jgi:hypothetical protein